MHKESWYMQCQLDWIWFRRLFLCHAATMINSPPCVVIHLILVRLRWVCPSLFLSYPRSSLRQYSTQFLFQNSMLVYYCWSLLKGTKFYTCLHAYYHCGSFCMCSCPCPSLFRTQNCKNCIHSIIHFIYCIISQWILKFRPHAKQWACRMKIWLVNMAEIEDELVTVHVHNL